MGIDLVFIVEAGAVFATLMLGKTLGWWLPAAIIPVVIYFFAFVHMPFQNRERWGRARRRRGECVWCGKEDIELGTRCCNCGATAERGGLPDRVFVGEERG
jgi:hypothetical protein